MPSIFPPLSFFFLLAVPFIYSHLINLLPNWHVRGSFDSLHRVSTILVMSQFLFFSLSFHLFLVISIDFSDFWTSRVYGWQFLSHESLISLGGKIHSFSISVCNLLPAPAICQKIGRKQCNYAWQWCLIILDKKMSYFMQKESGSICDKVCSNYFCHDKAVWTLCTNLFPVSFQHSFFIPYLLLLCSFKQCLKLFVQNKTLKSYS